MRNKNKFGFTLAEVLITITVIGTVAILVIPTFNANIQKKRNATLLKKAYFNFNQVLDKIAMDKKCMGDLACTGLFAAGTTHDTLGQAIEPYFSVIKSCGVRTGEGCMPSSQNQNFEGTGTAAYWDSSNQYKFVTTEGITYMLENYVQTSGNTWANCVTNRSTGETGNMQQMCGSLRLDVNGPQKGPNRMGRDIFVFYITNGKGPLLYPSGGVDDNSNLWWKTPGSGVPRYCPATPIEANTNRCAGRVMEENWEMNY